MHLRRFRGAPLRRTGYVAAVAAFMLLASGCWVSYGYDTNNSRATESQITPANVGQLHELWRVAGVVGSTSTPAVAGGTVYFGGWDGSLRAVSAATGAPIWTRQLANSVVDDSPLVYGNNVYAGDGLGNLHAVDAKTGSPVWTRELDPHPNTRIFSSPVAIEGTIVVGVASVEIAVPKPDYTFRGSIVGLDANTGVIKWRVYVTDNNTQSGAGVSVWSSAAVDQARKLVFIGTGNTYEAPASPRSDALMAIDYRDGTVKWVRQFTAGDVYTIFGTPPQGPDADIGAAPNLFTIGDQDVVGVGDKAGVYAVLDRDTGATVWAHEFPTGSHLGGIMMTSAYHDGTLYISSNRWANLIDFHNAGNTSTTYAVDAATGTIEWQKNLPSAAFGALTYTNGVVFQPTITGTAYALDAADGDILWSAQPGADLGSGFSVVGKQVFVPYGFWFFAAPPNPNGGLVAYGLG